MHLRTSDHVRVRWARENPSSFSSSHAREHTCTPCTSRTNAMEIQGIQGYAKERERQKWLQSASLWLPPARASRSTILSLVQSSRFHLSWNTAPGGLPLDFSASASVLWYPEKLTSCCAVPCRVVPRYVESRTLVESVDRHARQVASRTFSFPHKTRNLTFSNGRRN